MPVNSVTPTGQKPYINRNTPGQKARRVGFGINATDLMEASLSAHLKAGALYTKKGDECLVAILDNSSRILHEAAGRVGGRVNNPEKEPGRIMHVSV